MKQKKPFLWGASVAAHQVEGNNHNQWTTWELQNANVLAAKARPQYDKLPNWPAIKSLATSPDNYISGKAADHYHLYKQDFALAAQLNFNALRFSIEWSRVQPNSSKDWDHEAVAHYRDYLKAMRAKGLEPVVTLWHFTNPDWFEALGGFAKPRNRKYLVAYARRIMEELGEYIHYVIPINEPDTYALEGYLRAEWPPQQSGVVISMWVYFNLCMTHRAIYKALKHDEQQSQSTDSPRQYTVAFNKGFTYYYRADGDIRSRLAEWASRFVFDDFILFLVMRRYDLIAVNYYFSVRFKGFKVYNPPSERRSDLGWGMHPNHLGDVLIRLAKYHKAPLMVTESGVADTADIYRKWWITENLKGIQRAQKRGARVVGYLHWALLDNFEWAHGRWPNFGLIAVDYKTFKRTIRPSASWYASAIALFKSREK